MESRDQSQKLPADSSPASPRPAPSHPARAVLARLETLLFGDPRPLSRTIEAILSRPDRRLCGEVRLRPVAEVRDPDPDRLLEEMADPQATRPAGDGTVHFQTAGGERYSFALLWDRRTRISHVTPANLELLRLLDRLLHEVRCLRFGDEPLPAEEAARASLLRRRLQAWRRQLVREGDGFAVAAATGGVVLEQDTRYREVRRVVVQLRRQSSRSPAPGCVLEGCGTGHREGGETP